LIAFIVTCFYVAGVVAAIEAVMTVRTAQGAIAWSVSLVSFPFVSVPAYLVFGRSKFNGVSQAYQERQADIDDLVNEMRTQLAPFKAGEDDSTEDLSALQRLTSMHQKISGMQLTRGNHAELLIDGEATFDSILEGISKAKDYVFIQFYMFHDDGIGRRVQQALIERANAGVRVFMLYDGVGSSGLPDSYVKKLEDAGVQVSKFKTTQGFRNQFQINFRNHRKMVVVDGLAGWLGGLNVGDEYMGLDPEFSPWRDTHLKLQGPSVIQLQSVCLWDWYWATREIPELNWKPVVAQDADATAMIVPTDPSQKMETASLFFVTAINSARERIWLTAPYFVPDEAVQKALELAFLRGVDVRVLMSGKPDSLPVFMAGFHFMQILGEHGIKFYSYEPGFLHEKVMLVDDQVSTVGTANFDNRSFRLNFEVTALVVDEAFASEVEAMLIKDFEHSKRIDIAGLDEKPFWWKVGVKLSRLASPIL